MKLIFSPNASKQVRKLALTIRKKLYKQATLLLTNPRHPSLRSKKMMTAEDKFEARIDYHYRFTYKIGSKEIWILSVGPHDEGLGKR